MDLRKISQASAEKLGRLNRDRTRLSQFLGDHAGAATTIRELGATGEIALLPDLLPFILDASGRVRAAAHSALSALLAAIPPGRLLEVDAWMRESLSKWDRRTSSWALMEPWKVSWL